jgi:phage N-6-adenine-methyltransferase
MKHFVSKSNTVEQEKDAWQTPKSLFDKLDQEFGFVLDVCASKDNSLCKYFFSSEDSALDNAWSTLGPNFLNPPYSQTQDFLIEAASQADQFNLTVVAVVNANTDTKWFAEAASTASEIRLITGRIGFIKPSGAKANGNTKGQCVIIWRGRSKSPCQIFMVNRDSL